MRPLYKIAHLEGWSYLILLVGAMPLKYLGGIDMAVKLIGSVHGLLFTAMFFAVLLMYIKKRLTLYTALLIMGASLIPFATFYTETIVAKYNRACQL
jgi:integral membrane protein